MIYLPEESNLSDRYVHLVFCRETQILRGVFVYFCILLPSL